MKKFILKIIPFLLFCGIIMIGIPVIIDPCNVFHWKKIRDNGIEVNKNYIKMKYILSNSDKFDTYLFGSSRVGAIHVDKIQNEKCYNMTYSMGVPEEHLANIKTFISSNIIPKKIYLGVDSMSYTENPQDHTYIRMRCPYEYLRENPTEFIKFYFNPNMAIESLKVTRSYVKKENIENIFYEYGWWFDYNETSTYDWSIAEPGIGDDVYLDDTLKDIKDIKTICDENNIELLTFVNPMCELTYRASLDIDYYSFLKQLSEITDYYNFSGLNDITRDYDNFLDNSHFTAEIGDMMIDCMCSKKIDETLYEQGFGKYVTKENINEFIEVLSGQK